MKILIIYPCRGTIYQKGYMPPLSPALLAALTPAGHDIQIVNDAVDRVPFDGDFDLIAITAMTVQATRAYELAAPFRARGIPVVMGGFHTTVLPDDARPHVDSVVIGEAEEIWPEIVADAQAGRLKDTYWGGHCDLQRQILPRFDLYDLKRYERIPWLKLPILPIYTTRGCPMGCDYCSVTLIHGKTFRHRPIAHVMEEFNQFDDSRFYFIVDDNVTGHPAYARELFKALKHRKDKRVNWFGQASVTLMKHPELIDLAAEAGCSSLFIGVESLNQGTLDGIGKKFNHVEEYGEFFKRLYAAGIVPFVSMIFGFDEDTEETFENALRFHDEHDVMLTAWWMLSPAPGTPFCERMKDEGRVLNRDWSHYDATKILIEPKSMSLAQLMRSYWRSYRRYFELTERINARVKERYRVSRHNYAGALHIQSLARKQVFSRHHPFAMGSV